MRSNKKNLRPLISIVIICIILLAGIITFTTQYTGVANSEDCYFFGMENGLETIFLEDTILPLGMTNRGWFYLHYRVVNSFFEMGIYRHTPKEGSIFVMQYFGGFVAVDDYGIYYTCTSDNILSLYVRSHDTNKSRILYQMCTEQNQVMGLVLEPLNDGRLNLFIMQNNNDSEQEENTVIQVYVKTEEVLWQMPLGIEPALVFINGDVVYRLAGRELLPNEMESILYRDDEVIFRGIQGFLFMRLGDYIVITLYYDEGEERAALLATPEGELISIPFGSYIAKVDELLLFYAPTFSSARESSFHVLYSYNLHSREIRQIYVHESSTIRFASSDGVWLYTNTHGERGDYWECWKFIFDEAGTPIGLELIVSNIIHDNSVE